MENMKMKVVSDGGVMGTRVYDADGNDRTGAFTRIEWVHEAGEFPKLQCTLHMQEFEGGGVIPVVLLEYYPTDSHQVRKKVVTAVEFHDGDRWDFTKPSSS